MLNNLRLYHVKFAGEDWQCLAVAESAQRARVLFWHEWKSQSDPISGFTTVRARLVKHVTIPPEELYEQLITTCQGWDCLAWGLTGEAVCNYHLCRFFPARLDFARQHKLCFKQVLSRCEETTGHLMEECFYCPIKDGEQP